MANLTNYSKSIFKASDKFLFEQLSAAIEQNNFSIDRIQLTPQIGGHILIENSTPSENEELMSILDFNGELIKMFDFHVREPKKSVVFFIRINRHNDKQHDDLQLNISNLNESVRSVIYPILNSAEKALKVVNSEYGTIENLGDSLSDRLKLRESRLDRLEEISENLIYEREQHRQRIEHQLNKQKETMEEEFSRKLSDLEKREKELEDRKKEVDDRAHRHARRKQYLDIKERLKKLSTTYSLSAGTIKKRTPVNVLVLTLVIFFGFMLFASTLQSMGLIPGAKIDLAFYFRQIGFAVAFASTIIFYIRWHGKWFDRHANEEFILMKNDSDIDRASWIVELASEWVDEKKQQFPDEIVKQFTKGLFEGQGKNEQVLHPADELATTIFGASSSAKICLPNGSEVNFDRKSHKMLEKDN